MAETYEARLNAKRKKFQDKIDELNKQRDAIDGNTRDAAKRRKRLNSSIKQQQRSLDNLNQKWAEMRVGIDAKGGKGKRIPTQSDRQLHHAGTSLNNARKFFEGLDPAEKLIMEKAFAQSGIVPGDVTMNALAMFEEQHQKGIHKYERELGLEGKSYFKNGATFQEKLDAVTDFASDQRMLRKVAEEATFKASEELGGLTRRVQATSTPEQSEEYHQIEGKRRRETARDIREYGPTVHAVAGEQVRPKIDTEKIKAGVVALDFGPKPEPDPEPSPEPKPKPTPKPKPKPKPKRIVRKGGSIAFRDVISTVTSMDNTLGGFGMPGDDNPFGGRTIEADPLFSGATFRIP